MCHIQGGTRGKYWDLEVTWTDFRGNREPVEVFKMKINDPSAILGR